MLRVSDQKIITKYRKKGFGLNIKYSKQNNHNIRYLIINDVTDLPTLFFIHGAPGYILDLKNYFEKKEILQHARIIAIERPGYGFSDYGKPLASIEDQAYLIGNILNREYKGPACLIAHSFGGPIAAKIAINQPSKVQKLILLAPAIDPDNEKIYKIAYLAKVKQLKRLIPTPLLVAAEEKFKHVAELEKLKPDWNKLVVAVDYFHGTSDWIVPYANMHFAQRHFTRADANFITLPGANHFINFFPKKEIVASIRNWIQATKKGK